MKSNVRGKVFVTLIFLVIAVVAGVLVARTTLTKSVQGREEFRFPLAEAGELQRGDSVVLGGRTIGEVTDVVPASEGESLVTIAIDRSHASAVIPPPEGTARVVTGDRVENRHLLLINRNDPDAVAASDLDTLAKHANTLIAGVSAQLDQARTRLEQEDFQQLKARIDGVQAELEELGRTGLEKGSEALNLATEKARQISEELRQKSAETLSADTKAAAERLQKEANAAFDKASESLKKATEEITKETEQATHATK